jgi:hypothetical protein
MDNKGAKPSHKYVRYVEFIATPKFVRSLHLSHTKYILSIRFIVFVSYYMTTPLYNDITPRPRV